MSETIACSCGHSISTDHECYAALMPFRLKSSAYQAVDRYIAKLTDQEITRENLDLIVSRVLGMFQTLGESGRIYQCYNCGRVFADDSKYMRFEIGEPKPLYRDIPGVELPLDLKIWDEPVRSRPK